MPSCRSAGSARCWGWRALASTGGLEPANDNDLGLMRRIDELFTAWPFLGSRRMALMLRRARAADQPQARAAADAADGHRGDRARSRARPSRRRATRSSRICCAGWRSSGRTRCGQPTSPTCRSGAASCTWWRSWTGPAGRCWRGGCRTRWTASFCVEALEEALARFGRPEIFNTDQGSQFTSAAFTGVLAGGRRARSAWTAAGGGWTTCSSSGCGGR